MNQEQRERLDSIRDKALTIDPAQSAWASRQDAANDILWLVQFAELQDTQIEMLSAPEHVRRLLRDFSNLTQVRQALVLELMREMKEAQHEN